MDMLSLEKAEKKAILDALENNSIMCGKMSIKEAALEVTPLTNMYCVGELELRQQAVSMCRGSSASAQSALQPG